MDILVDNCAAGERHTFTITEPIAKETEKVFWFITREPRQKFWIRKSDSTVIRYTDGERSWLEVTTPANFFDKHIKEIARL